MINYYDKDNILNNNELVKLPVHARANEELIFLIVFNTIPFSRIFIQTETTGESKF